MTSAQRFDSGDPKSDSTSDSLLEGVKSGDPKAWRMLVDLDGRAIYNRARHAGVSEADAADVVQQTFLEVWRYIGRFRRERDKHSFRRWVSTLASNNICDCYRRRRGRARAEGGSTAQQFLEGRPAAPPPMSVSSLPDDDLRVEARRAYEMICEEFSQRDREVFEELVFDGHKPAEIARERGISAAAVHKVKSRIVGRLRRFMADLQ